MVTRAWAKGIFPTLAGRDVLRCLNDLLDRYTAMMTDLADLESELSGALAVGYNALIAPAFLPEICAPLMAEHSQITLARRLGYRGFASQHATA